MNVPLLVQFPPIFILYDGAIATSNVPLLIVRSLSTSRLPNNLNVAVHKLRQKFFGVSDFKVKVIEPYQMLGEIDTDIINILGLDVIGVLTPKNMFGFKNENWKSFKMKGDIEVLVPDKLNYS